MVLGDTRGFAIECEFTGQFGAYLHGSFRVWLNGEAPGTFSEEVLSPTATTGTLRDPVKGAPIPAASLDAAGLLERVFPSRYGDGEHDEVEDRVWGCPEWLARGEGFATLFPVAAHVGNDIRIVWRPSDMAAVRGHHVVVGTCPRTCAGIIARLDEGIESRRRGEQHASGPARSKAGSRLSPG